MSSNLLTISHQSDRQLRATHLFHCQWLRRLLITNTIYMQVHATLTNTLPNYWAVARPVIRLQNISATVNNTSEPSDQTWAWKREVCQVMTLKHDNTITSVTPSSWYLAPGHKNLHRWQTLSILPTVPQFMHLLIASVLAVKICAHQPEIHNKLNDVWVLCHHDQASTSSDTNSFSGSSEKSDNDKTSPL